MKYLICVLAISALCSCLQETTIEINEQTGTNKESMTLEYVPNGKVETFTLNNGLTVYMDEDSVYFLEDIIFSKEQISLMNVPSTRSAILCDMVKYWSTSIPYQILPGFSAMEIQYIKDAMNEISAVSPIIFYESKTSKRIIFTPNEKSNSSPIGMQPKGNTILLANGKFSKGSAMHEILHSLGIFHEQSRSDRDSYITINWNNIESGKVHNFDKYKIDYHGLDVESFDFNSIMLYPSDAFSKNNEPTMVRKSDGSIFDANRYYLSEGDIAGINCFYGPAMELYSKVTDEFEQSGQDYIDRRTYYSYDIYFYSSTGERITLKYPRLIVVAASHVVRTSESDGTIGSLTYSYYVAPAGSSSYSLPETVDIYQSDMGILRLEEYTTYELVY